jgi:hypothetical protein
MWNKKLWSNTDSSSTALGIIRFIIAFRHSLKPDRLVLFGSLHEALHGRSLGAECSYVGTILATQYEYVWV